jgi:predicted phage-related endonuclease
MALSKEQKELRRSGITASELAVLCGLSRWSSPIAIYAEKMGQPLEDTAGLPAELGDLLEEPLAKLYSERTGLHLARCRTMRSPVHARVLATLDRAGFPERRTSRAYLSTPAELEGAIDVEFKTTTWRLKDEWGVPGTDQVPERTVVQVQVQMGVTGLRHADVGVLFDRDSFDIYHVPFNEQLWLGLVEVANRFWVDHVEAGRPPLPDASDKYKEYLSKAFPATTGEVLELQAGDARAELVRRYAQLSALEKATEAEKKLAGNQLRALLGEAKAFTVPGLGTLNRVWTKASTGTDWEALARALAPPEVLNEKLPGYQRETRAGFWKLQPAFDKAVKAELGGLVEGAFERLGLAAGVGVASDGGQG